jgi:WXG100 family type VII secretion target
MDEIKAAYDQLDNISGRFTGQAEAITAMVQRLQSCFSQLEDGGWMGRGAEAFFDEMNSEIFPACQRLIAVLEDSGASTRSIAERMQQAEDEAANLFRNP